MLLTKLFLLLSIGFAFAKPFSWQAQIVSDSSWYYSQNQKTSGKIHQGVFQEWLLSKSSQRLKMPTEKVAKVLERVREIGLQGNPLYVTEARVVPVFLFALQDTNITIQEQATRILVNGISRSSLMKYKREILESKYLDSNSISLLMPLVVNDVKARDSLLEILPKDLILMRASLGDTAAERKLLGQWFPDSLFLKDTVSQVLVIPGQKLSEAKYYHLCGALDNLGNLDGALTRIALGNIAKQGAFLEAGTIMERFTYKLAQRYARFYEEDTIIGRAIATIRSYRTENALKRLGATPERVWIHADSAIYSRWGFHLAKAGADSVWFHRNYHIDPKDDQFPSVYLRK